MNRCLTVVLFVFAGLYSGGCDREDRQARTEGSPETRQAIATLRAAYAAFNRGDIDAALAPFDPQIDWSEPLEFGGATAHGLNGVKQYLTQSRSAWAEGSSEPEKFIPVGSHIVVFVHAHFRPNGSGQWQDLRLADVYTFRGGKAIRMRAFADRQEALRRVNDERSNP